MILTEQHLESQVSELLLRADFVKALIYQLSAMRSVAPRAAIATCARGFGEAGTFSSRLVPSYFPFRTSRKERGTRSP